MVVLGAVWACSTPDKSSDAGPADTGSAETDSGPSDAGIDGGRNTGDAGGDGGPDSGCTADAACGITTPPGVGDPGWFCTMDSQCHPEDGGFCQARYHRCSRPCGSIADCPITWTCAPLIANGPDVCQCPVQPPVPDVCNNVDDNCDGIVDNGNELCPIAELCTNGTCGCPAANQCGNLCTDKQTDVFNCGACGHACAEGFVCSGGGCTCPNNASNFLCQVTVDGGTVDAGPSFVCVDSASDPRHCGACENACDSNQDCISGSCQGSTHEWARWSFLATPSFSSGSSAGPDGGTIATVNDSLSGLTWQQDVATSTFSWSDAPDYCASLGTGWRVPTRIELFSIVDYTRFHPAINPSVFPQSTSAWLSTTFWTATPSAMSSSAAWSVDFSNGASNAQPKTTSYPVRCVR